MQTSFIARAWRGEERLWKVWWILGLALGTISIAILKSLAPASTAATLHPLMAVVVLFVPYLAWCKMAWSCAMNVDWKYWGIGAKVLIALGLVQSLITLITANLE